LFSFGQFVQAQPTLGIVWDIPNDSQSVEQQLHLFEKLGVTHLEIKNPVSEELLTQLENSNFSILIRSQNRFYTLESFDSNKNSFQENVYQLIADYKPYSRVAGLGIISQSHFRNTEFSSAFYSASEQFSSQTDKTLYHFLNNKWYSLDNPDLPFGQLLTDTDYETGELTKFDRQFKVFVESSEEQILFMHSAWLITVVREFPEFRTSLTMYSHEGSWSMPLPHQGSTSLEANWLVLALILFWIVLAVQVKFIPNARAMILRYYFAHRFYVDDILHYRERYATQSIIMMVIHAFAGGIVVYVLSALLLSESGLEALYYHLPWLEIFGSGYYSISILAFITLIVLQFVSVFWLYLPAKNLDHVSQIANLYAGLLYTDYMTLTLLISFYLTDFSTALVITLATFYVLIGFINFYLTAFNTARNIGPEKLIYFMITAVLHTVASVTALVYLLTQTQIIEIISLSISLN
jgi:hypothetical protein